MRKVYDCFTFFNELDLLELRLSESFDAVDKFVLVESNISFAGNKKPFFFEENKDRFAPFMDKIIHIKVTDTPDTNAWGREYFQRNAIERGLGEAGNDDVIAISDCDELMRPRTFNIMRNDTGIGMWICRHPMFYFKANYMMVAPMSYHVNPMAVVKGQFQGAQALRNHMVSWAYRQPEDYNTETVRTIQHSGWHFTYFGDTAHAATKLLNFAHTESQHWANVINVDEILSRKGGIDPTSTERFEYIKVDEYFPKTIRDNPDRWAAYVLPGAEQSIRQYVPALDIAEIYK